MIAESIVKSLDHIKTRQLAGIIAALSLIIFIYNLSYLFYYQRHASNHVFHFESIFQRYQDHPVDYVSLDLFGHYGEGVSPAIIPISALNLNLESILYSQRLPKESYIMIQSPGGSSQLYREGDDIKPGIRIKKILRRKVIVDNNKRLEIIRLPSVSTDSTLIAVRDDS